MLCNCICNVCNCIQPLFPEIDHNQIGFILTAHVKPIAFVIIGRTSVSCSAHHMFKISRFELPQGADISPWCSIALFSGLKCSLPITVHTLYTSTDQSLFRYILYYGFVRCYTTHQMPKNAMVQWYITRFRTGHNSPAPKRPRLGKRRGVFARCGLSGTWYVLC